MPSAWAGSDDESSDDGLLATQVVTTLMWGGAAVAAAGAAVAEVWADEGGDVAPWAAETEADATSGCLTV